MLHLRPLVLGLAVVLCSVLARAQGRVQIVLHGTLAEPGGARVEALVTFAGLTEEGGLRKSRVDLGLHLADGTTAAELGALLEREILRQGGAVQATFAAPEPIGSAGAQPARACLFIERMQSVALRLGRGLTASITLSDAPPGQLRFLPPKEKQVAARLSVTASAENPHTKDRPRFAMAVEFAGGLTGEQAADVVTTQAIAKGWTGTWLGHQAWSPEAQLQSGARITGTCFELISAGDWRIELDLPAPEPRGQ